MDPIKAAKFKTQNLFNPEDFVQPLYDRVNIATTVVNKTFFAIPIGQNDTLITGTSAASKSKTHRDTNMETAGVIPVKLYVIHAISLAFVHSDPDGAANAQDENLFMSGTYLKFRIVDKDVLYLPCAFIPTIGGVLNAATTATSTSINTFRSNPTPAFRLDPAITLEPNQNFNVNINVDGTVSLTATMDVYIVLWGVMRRPT